MINFIICDDNEFFLMEIYHIISNFCLSKKINFKIYAFKDYDSEFYEIMCKELDNKVYILDIETPSGNGIDIAKKIRNKDLNAFLIFISAYTAKYISQVVSSDTMFIGYISKRKNYRGELVKKLKQIFKFGFQNNVIRFKDQGIIYTFDMRNIIYIEADSRRRRSIIHTCDGIIEVRLTLKQLKQILDYRFEYSHRSCIINHEQVIYIDTVVKVIKFKNGTMINLLSDSFIRKIRLQTKPNTFHVIFCGFHVVFFIMC